MIDFDSIPERFDSVLASDGIEFTANDEYDNWLGDYVGGLIDMTLKHVKVTRDALIKKYERDIRANKLVGDKDRYATAELLVKTAKLRWTSVPFKDKETGKPVEYSEENAIKLFSTDHPTIDYLIGELNRFYGDVSNFKGNDPKETAKN